MTDAAPAAATLAALVRRAADRLRERDSPFNTPELDAEVLARHVLGWDRARWIAESRGAPPPDFTARFDALIDRRMRHEPVAYLTRSQEFWGHEFEVSPEVLIPRPETELLVERALDEIDRRGATRVLDVGTGSGCIAIALALERPALTVVAVDVSSAALALATRNAARHGVRDRIEFVHTAGTYPLTSVDLVVSNPPYIGESAAASLMKDVVDYEPHVALFAGDDGAAVIRAILTQAKRVDPVPPVLLEFGGDEAGLRRVVDSIGMRLVEIIPDLQGIPRVAVVEA